MKLSIVIVNWNSKTFLEKCLESIYSNSPPFPFEIIIVDNASSDGSVEMVKERFPLVKVIENVENPGFSKGCNQGAKISQGEHLLFLNPDTLIHRDTIDSVIKFMEEHSDAGIVGCKTLNEDGSLQSSAYNFPSPFRMLGFISRLNRIFKISKLKNHNIVNNPDYIQGSFLLVRKSVFDRVNGFDENFFMYSEDVDICIRVKKLGFKVFFYPYCSITHFGAGSSRVSHKSLEYFIKSLFYLYKKHKTKNDLKRLKFALIVGLYICLIFEFFLSLKQSKHRIYFYKNLIAHVKNEGKS